jgi:inorganic pyrophosphatase
MSSDATNTQYIFNMFPTPNQITFRPSDHYNSRADFDDDSKFIIALHESNVNPDTYDSLNYLRKIFDGHIEKFIESFKDYGKRHFIRDTIFDEFVKLSTDVRNFEGLHTIAKHIKIAFIDSHYNKYYH